MRELLSHGDAHVPRKNGRQEPRACSSLSLHEKYQGHCLGAAEYLLKEQEQSICSKGALTQRSVRALKHQRVLLTPRPSAQDGPGGAQSSRMALDSGSQESCAHPQQPGQSCEKLALPSSPAQSRTSHPQWERQGTPDPDPDPEQGWPPGEPAGASRGMDPARGEVEG